MKQLLLPVLTNIMVIIFIPLILNNTETTPSLLATYLVLGISLYFFIASNIFTGKLTTKTQVIIFCSSLVILAIIMQYLFFGQIVVQYLILNIVLMALGLRLGSTKRKILALRNENIQKKNDND